MQEFGIEVLAQPLFVLQNDLQKAAQNRLDCLVRRLVCFELQVQSPGVFASPQVEGRSRQGEFVIVEGLELLCLEHFEQIREVLVVAANRQGSQQDRKLCGAFTTSSSMGDTLF